MSNFYKRSTSNNGIRILSESMPSVRSIALGVWIGAGSRDEPKELGGVSHFLEHMMFKGTPSRTAKEISESFESIGAELNAFTAKEVTTFYTRMLDEHLPLGIEVLADMLLNSSFKEADIKSEKQVVLEELSLHEDSPDEIIHDLISDSVFNGHPLGKRVLGNQKTVKTFNRKKVKDYYSKAYTPNNMVIAAAGNIGHSKLEDLINRYFVSKTKNIFRRKIKDAKEESSLRIIKKKNSEQAHICLGTLALSATDKDRFALSVLDNVMGGGMSSRLFQEIREKRGLAYSVYSYHSVHTETGAFSLYVGTSPKNATEVIKIMKNEINRIKEEEASENELYRAKQHIKGQLVLGLESTSHRMMRLGKSELAQGKIYSVDELIEKIDKVTPQDIKRLANKLFQKERLNLAAIGPFTEKTFARIISN